MAQYRMFRVTQIKKSWTNWIRAVRGRSFMINQRFARIKSAVFGNKRNWTKWKWNFGFSSKCQSFSIVPAHCKNVSCQPKTTENCAHSDRHLSHMRNGGNSKCSVSLFLFCLQSSFSSSTKIAAPGSWLSLCCANTQPSYHRVWLASSKYTLASSSCDCFSFVLFYFILLFSSASTCEYQVFDWCLPYTQFACDLFSVKCFSTPLHRHNIFNIIYSTRSLTPQRWWWWKYCERG